MLQRLKRFLTSTSEAATATSVADWASQNQYTPDIWQLEQFEWQHIFVPYPFQMDFSSEKEMLEAVRLGRPTHPTCYTRHPFHMFVKDLGKNSYPIPIPKEFEPSNFLRWPAIPARIRGQMWSIPPKLFISLDKAKQNGVQFRRQRVHITLPWREVKYDDKSPLPYITDDYVVTKSAWMYIGLPDYWHDQIGGIFTSCQVEHKEFVTPKKWIDRFYEFEKPK
jgi:hypothetical protein